MKVLVCGGRLYDDRETLFTIMDALHQNRRGPVSLLVHGNANGADALAKEWASSRGLLQRWWAADWKTHGNGAGPIRNQKMLDEGKPDLVVAFPGGRGTADMVARATRAGVEVIHVGCEPDDASRDTAFERTGR